MNSYEFNLLYSVFFLALALFAIVGVAFWSYRRTIPPISSGLRSLLVALRSLGLFALVLVLFEPSIGIVGGKETEPKLAFLIDNSASMVAEDAAGSRLGVVQNVLNSLDKITLDDEQIRTISFAENASYIYRYKSDSLSFDGNASNIASAINLAGNAVRKDHIKAGLLISDGAFNMGDNPLYALERFGEPLFVIGIGDTNKPKDIAIRSIFTNQVAYLNNPNPVSVEVSSVGFENVEADVVLYDNNSEVSRQSLTVFPNKESYQLLFDYTPKQAGNRKLTIEILPKGSANFENEVTTKNNTFSDYIKVLENKRKVALFASSSNPDVSFIQSELSRNPNVEVDFYIQKKGSEFYQAPTREFMNKSEMIFLIDFPNVNSSEESLNLIIEQLNRGKPLFFIAGKNIHPAKLAKISSFLPFDITQFSQREYLATPDVSSVGNLSALLRVTGTEQDYSLWNALPPIYRSETFVRMKPQANVIMTYKLNNAPLPEPLIASMNFQNRKTLAVLGYGIYRWKLAGYAPNVAKGYEDSPDLLSFFLNNSFDWLSTDIQNKLVNVRTSKKSYLQGERVEFLGQVYDETYKPLEDADLEVEISSKDGNITNLVMSSQGNGRYIGYQAGLISGDYSFVANAKLKGTSIGKDDGRFEIGETAIEYQNLTMNINLLRSLAERSGGKFYFPNQVDEFLADFEQLSKFKPKVETVKSEIALWNLPWILAFAITCFSIEWFLRKKSGMM